MIKKYSKLFVITLLAFFISIISVNAKEMSVSELGSEILSRNPNAGYVYVIGRYAFTSSYATKFDIKDIMLAAADSININLGEIENLEDYSENMTIYQIDRISQTEWELKTNVVGNGEAYNDEAKVDVSFIDYEYIVSDTNINANIKEQVESLNGNASDYGFASITYDNYTATFNISDPSRNLIDYKESGILDVIKALVAPETGAKTIAWDGHEASDITNLEEDDIIALAAEVLTRMIGKDAKTLTYAEAANKSITATVTYTDENGYKYSVDYTLKFIYNFEEQKAVKLEELAGTLNTTVNQSGNEKYGFRGVEFKDNTLTFDISNPDASLVDFKDSGIVDLFLANYAGATTVEYYFDGTLKDTFDLTTEELNAEAVISMAGTVLKAMVGEDELILSSVAGKSATAIVTWADGTTTTYTLTFIYNFENVQDDLLVKDAQELNSEIAENDEWGFRGLEYNPETNTATFEIKNPEANLAEFKDSTVVELFKKFIEGATSVTYYVNGEASTPIDLTDDLDDEAIKGYAAEILTKMIAPEINLTLGAVAGKTAYAVVTYANGEEITYYLSFVYNVEEVKDDTLFADAEKLNEKLTDEKYGFKSIVYDKETNTATFTVATDKDEVLLSTFKDSGIVDMFKTIVKSVKSMSYNVDDTDVPVTLEGLDDDDDAVIALAAELLQAMVGEGKDLKLANVVGKTATATVDYGYGEPITYTLTFVQE